MLRYKVASFIHRARIREIKRILKRYRNVLELNDIGLVGYIVSVQFQSHLPSRTREYIRKVSKALTMVQDGRVLRSSCGKKNERTTNILRYLG